MAAEMGGLGFCAVDGCPRRAQYGRAGYCRGHYARKEKGRPVNSPLREFGMPIGDQIQRLATRFAEAEDDASFERAREYMLRYVRRLRRRK